MVAGSRPFAWMRAGTERRTAGPTIRKGCDVRVGHRVLGDMLTTTSAVVLPALGAGGAVDAEYRSFIARNRLRQVRDGVSGICALHGELPDWKHDFSMFSHLHSPSTCTNIS